MATQMAENKSNGFEFAYYVLIIVALAIIAIFSYMTCIFYSLTKGTSAFKFTLLIPLPIVVSFILLILLISSGKKAVAEELRNFFSKN